MLEPRSHHVRLLPLFKNPALPLISGSTFPLSQHLDLCCRPGDQVRIVGAHPDRSSSCTETWSPSVYSQTHTFSGVVSVEPERFREKVLETWAGGGLTFSLGTCCSADLLRLRLSAHRSSDLLHHEPAGWTEQKTDVSEESERLTDCCITLLTSADESHSFSVIWTTPGELPGTRYSHSCDQSVIKLIRDKTPRVKMTRNKIQKISFF